MKIQVILLCGEWLGKFKKLVNFKCWNKFSNSLPIYPIQLAMVIRAEAVAWLVE